MPKRADIYVTELTAALDAMTAAAQDGLHVLQIVLSAWGVPELLVTAQPHLVDLPSAAYRGPTPDGGEEWAAPYHGCLVTWFRDLPVADLNRLPAGTRRVSP